MLSTKSIMTTLFILVLGFAIISILNDQAKSQCQAANIQSNDTCEFYIQ